MILETKTYLESEQYSDGKYEEYTGSYAKRVLLWKIFKAVYA